MKPFGIAGLALALLAPSVPASAEPVNLTLNWTPTADHSPFYYAKAQGWYEKAGIDLTIEVGKGSGVSSLKVGSGGSPFGIADLATALVARSKGADVVALMSIYANTGQTFYWLKSYGVNGAFLEKNPKLAEDFVRISQKAFAACVADVTPCLKALLDQVSGLDKANQERQWERIKFLMTDEFTTTKALGWIDAERMKKDYELVQTYLGMEKPFAVDTAFSTKLLDTAIKMDASKVSK